MSMPDGKHTYTIQIGNSDNKLSQDKWSDFINTLRASLEDQGWDIHFFGFSAPDAPWQNCCVVVIINDGEDVDILKDELRYLSGMYNQDSIALTTGTTEFIKGE